MAKCPAATLLVQLPLTTSTMILTPREHEVWAYVAQGYSCKLIAKRLCISEYTVKKHRASLLAKLGQHNGIELIRSATAKNPMATMRPPSRSRWRGAG